MSVVPFRSPSPESTKRAGGQYVRLRAQDSKILRMLLLIVTVVVAIAVGVMIKAFA